MTLELADRLITRPKGVVEDVFVKVGKFHFPTDFVVVDFEADPRVPLILGRSFLRTGRALINVYGEEITLRVNDKFITFNLNQTMRYSSTYDDTLVNRVDVIDIACEDKEPIVKSSSPTLTPFGESDFYSKEIKDFLNDDSIPIEIENFVFDPEGDILLIEKLLNEDPCQLSPMDLKLAEELKEKSFVEEPPKLQLKELPSHLDFFQNQPSTSGTLPSNTIPNPNGEMKAVTTRCGLAYEGPSIPTESPLEKVDEQITEEILDKEHSNSSGSTAQVQPLVVPISIPKPDVPRTQPKPLISYPSRLNDQKLREKATNQMEKFFQNFHDLHFDISFADALLLMPKFASTIKRMEICHALADLRASINLMPLSIWKKLSLPELTPTRINLELADRSITRPKRVAEDVFIKVGKFHFLTDFIVVNFEADLRVPLILGRSFLRTGCALIDVYGEEITLRVNDESITFNLNQTMRYSSTYDDTLVNRVDVIDVTCEDFVQDVLDFQYNPKSSNPTLVSGNSIFENDFCKVPIIKSSSLTLTPFRESNFILKEIKDFLNDDSIQDEIDDSVFDPEGDIHLIEKLLNADPGSLPPMDLKLAEESKEKSFVEEPPELELKDLPSYLEYAFLENSNKFPVIIAKNLKVDEREALLNVLKSHKRAIAWKIFDSKGIDPRFCTHKILMEDDYKPAVQSQRRVNPKIHDVIKKEVIKLLYAGMKYPIFDSPWVSPIHCVPKKGGITVVANENNELILTRLVTGWRVCIDYRKLNDATRKDHFPLPFMDQMLERLAGNEFYCFLDGFSGYFQILIDQQDQEKTTFTCPYGTFAYRLMPFGLCNAPGT
nr:reverse transcriptase domain-containing protein [Tanacetum cinerariifolium]